MKAVLLAIAVLFSIVFTVACGHKIGDSCNSSIDCSEDGSRTCDALSPEGGYCTVFGCDFGTCPEEAVCVRFFPGLSNAPACASQIDCAADEICTVAGACAPRSIERRFCMLACESAGDCRGGYECRNEDLMRRHGGEPVPDPTASTATPPRISFCASQRSCTLNTECDPGEICDFDTHTCRPQ